MPKDRLPSGLENLESTETGLLALASEFGDGWLSTDGLVWRDVVVMPPDQVEYPVAIAVKDGLGGWLGSLDAMWAAVS